MDEDEINSLIQACKLLKYKFCGVFAAENFPLKLSEKRFIIALIVLEHIGHFFVGRMAITFSLIRLDRN